MPKYIDYLIKNNPVALDGASCTFLFGRKISTHVIDKDIISQYTATQILGYK